MQAKNEGGEFRPKRLTAFSRAVLLLIRGDLN
jgi:hypothetical protein